jgi:hypothetical protein
MSKRLENLEEKNFSQNRKTRLLQGRLNDCVRLINVGIADEEQLFRLLTELQLDPNILDVALVSKIRENSMQRLPIHLAVEPLVLLVVGDQLIKLGRIVNDLVQVDGFQNRIRASQATNLKEVDVLITLR